MDARSGAEADARGRSRPDRTDRWRAHAERAADGHPAGDPGRRARRAVRGRLHRRAHTFLSESNISTMLRLAAAIGVVSVGMTFVIISGGIDLSVGSMVALASVWMTTVATQVYGPWVMVGCALAVGLGAGLVNGVLIAYGRVVPFIATLAMYASARGLAERLSDRRDPGRQGAGFLEFFRGDLLGIPVLIWMLAVVYAVGWVLLNRTTFGRRTFAVGGNAEAARLAGINVKRHTALGVRARRPVLRHRRAHGRRPHHIGRLDQRAVLRAGRDRGGRHRRHAADRRPRHADRHAHRRADLHRGEQHLHPEQPRDSHPEHRQGRDHRRRGAAPVTARPEPGKPSARTSNRPLQTDTREYPCPTTRPWPAAGSSSVPPRSARARCVVGCTSNEPANANSNQVGRRRWRQRPARQGGHDRLLRAGRRPRLDRRDHQERAGAGRGVRGRDAEGHRGHQRRQPADRPGRDAGQGRASTCW